MPADRRPSEQPRRRGGARGGGGEGGAAAKTGPPSGDLDPVDPTVEESSIFKTYDPDSAAPRPAAPRRDLIDPDATRKDTANPRPAPTAKPAARPPVQPTTPGKARPAISKPTLPASPLTGQTGQTGATGESNAATSQSPGSRLGSADPPPPLDPNVQALVDLGVMEAAPPAARRRGAFAVVAGRYELRKQLGVGGMGVVFLAYDNAGDCLVALKTLKPRFLKNPEARVRFLDEAKEMNRIPAHARVLVVKDFGSLDRPFYVTEYIGGGSLGDRIKLHGIPPRDEARRHARDLATAIAYIHAKHGKLHRDIKPENLLLDDQGSAWLADFGLVWQVGEGARGLRAGTIPYMPPEVVVDARKNVGYEWDVYAFGATLYEMLTGHPPYADVMKRRAASSGAKLDDLKKIIAAQPPTPIRERNRKADKSLTRIAEWAMARDARDRYFHVDHILNDLAAIREGRKPRGPLQKTLADGGGERPRRPGWHVLLTAVVLGIVATAAGVFLVPGLEERAEQGAQRAWAAVAGWVESTGWVAGRADDIEIEGDDSTSIAPASTGAAAVAQATKPPPPLLQVNPDSPLGLRFDTAGGRRVYRVADPTVWDRLAAEGVADPAALPADQALRFTASAERPGHLTIFAIEAGGHPVQFFPNADRPSGSLNAGDELLYPAPPGSGESTRQIKLRESGRVHIKAIYTDRPWTAAGVDLSLARPWPTPDPEFRINVDGRTFASFDEAFGDRWQTAEFDIDIRR